MADEEDKKSDSHSDLGVLSPISEFKDAQTTATESSDQEKDADEKIEQLRSTLSNVLGEENLGSDSATQNLVPKPDTQLADGVPGAAAESGKVSNTAGNSNNDGSNELSAATNDNGSNKKDYARNQLLEASNDNVTAAEVPLNKEEEAGDKLNESNNMEDEAQEKEDAKYISPIEDPYEKAWKYLSKHDILSLFGVITADIVYGKPEDPIDFMIDEIEKLQELDRIRKGVIKRTPSAALSTKARVEPEDSILSEIPS